MLATRLLYYAQSEFVLIHEISADCQSDINAGSIRKVGRLGVQCGINNSRRMFRLAVSYLGIILVLLFKTTII